MQTTESAFGMKGHRLACCSEIAPLLVFYRCVELDAQEKQQIDAHLATCLSCGQRLRALNPFETAPQMDPSGEFLARCRSELRELLDDSSVPLLRTCVAIWLDAAKNGFVPMFG